MNLKSHIYQPRRRRGGLSSDYRPITRACNSYLYTMSARDVILKQLRNIKPDLTSRYPIKSLGLFGSVARNKASESSDVDILIELDQPIGSAFFEIANEIEDVLQQPVDLVSSRGVKKKYLYHIQKDLIYV